MRTAASGIGTAALTFARRIARGEERTGCCSGPRETGLACAVDVAEAARGRTERLGVWILLVEVSEDTETASAAKELG